MSELTSPVRVPRPATTAVERARLALVPVRAVRAPRAPFAVLVFLILGAGVVGLLMFNTKMQQDSFHATRLEQRADALTAEREALQMELDGLRDPQHLAIAARQLGMVVPPVPAFVTLKDDKIVNGSAADEPGAPIPPLFPQGTGLPVALRPPARVQVVVAPPTQEKAKASKKSTKVQKQSGTSSGTSSGNASGNASGKPGRASTDPTSASGTND